MQQYANRHESAAGDAILDGTQRPDLSLTMLLRDCIPLDWAEQNRRFGTR